MDELVELGNAYKGHGLRGEVKLNFYNPMSSFNLKGKKVFLMPLTSDSSLAADGQWFEVQAMRGAQKIILKIKGFDDLTMVEKILPFTLSVSRDQLPALEEGEYLLGDLVGLRVLDHESKEEIGKITAFREGNLGVNLIFKKPNNEEIELPFKDQFFPDLDLESKTITCRLPEYV